MQTQSLFDGLVVDAPPTEGIKYAGSKLKLLPYILQLAKQVEADTVFDAFSGTTRVSQAFAKSGCKVYCNDIAVWSEVLGNCYLRTQEGPDAYQELIAHLNHTKPVDGWFTEHYGGVPNGGSAIQSDGMKKPWQIHNTRKLDGVRDEIESLQLGQVDKAVALTSLMLALDKVDSTLGHFASYLKEWAPRSYMNLQLRVPMLFSSEHEHQVFRYLRLCLGRCRCLMAGPLMFLNLLMPLTQIWHISIRPTVQITRRCRPHGCDTPLTITSGQASAFTTGQNSLEKRNEGQTHPTRLHHPFLKNSAVMVAVASWRLRQLSVSSEGCEPNLSSCPIALAAAQQRRNSTRSSERTVDSWMS